MRSPLRNVWIVIASITTVASAGCGMQVEKFSESVQPAITALSITPQSPSILIKQTVQLNAVASYANGSTATIT